MPNEDESDYEEENESKEETDKEDNKDLEDESDNKEDKDFEEESENEDKSDIEEENNDEENCDTEERSNIIEDENNEEENSDTEERSDIIEENDNEEGNDNKEGRDFEEQYIETEDEFEFLYNENLDITDESEKSDEIIEQNDESEPDFELLYNEEIENDEKSREEQNEEREREKEDDEPNFDELFETKFDVDQEKSLNYSSENQEKLEDSDDHGSITEEVENFDEIFEDNDWITQELKGELPEIPELLQNDVQNQLNQAEDNFSHLFNDEICSDLNDDKENLHKSPNSEKKSNQGYQIENFDHLYVDNFNLKSILDLDSNSNSDSVAHQENDISPNITDINEFQNTNASIENPEKLGNNEVVEQNKNIVQKNFDTESKNGEQTKTENEAEKQTENQNKNQKEILEREMKDKDTKIEVICAEADPKSAEKELRKLPEPPHEKKDKVEKKIDKIDKLTQNIENAESNLMEQISENLENQTKELKEIKGKTDENLERVVIANHFALEEYKHIYQKAFIYFVDEHCNAQNEIKRESDNIINNSIDKNQKKIEKIENKIKKEFNKTLPTPKGMKNVEGIKPDENKTEQNKSREDNPGQDKPREKKPREDKKDENKPEEIKPEQQIKKLNQTSENKKNVGADANVNAKANANHDKKNQKENTVSPKIHDKNNDQNTNTNHPKIKSENLGDNKDSKKEKNIIHENLDSVKGNSSKNNNNNINNYNNNNLQAEKKIEKTLKPGNLTKEQIKIKNKTENEYKNIIEKRLREMKDENIKSEVFLAEKDPKSSEKILKKLPEPPHEKKNKKEKKIEKIENKVNKLTQKLDNVENQLLQDISKTINSQTKELNDINEKANQNIEFVFNSNIDLELDQIHENAYYYYVDELMKAKNENEKKTDVIIDKNIDEKQKNIDKIDEKIEKAFNKAFPTPKGVKISDKTKIKENMEDRTKTKEDIKDKVKPKGNVKEKNKNEENLTNKTKTKENVKEKNKTKEKTTDKTKTKDNIKEKTKIKEKKTDKTKTKDNIKEKTKIKEKTTDKTKTKENVKEKTKIKEIVKEKLKIKEKTKSMNEKHQKENETNNNFYSEILSTIKNKEFIEIFNQKYISEILKKISSSSKEFHLNPNIKKSPFWEYFNWLDKGYQKDCISSEIGRKINQKNPRHNNMPIFVEGSPRNLIKTAFNLPNGKNWQKTLDYQIKNYLISNYQRIKNPFQANKIMSNESYRRKISVSSKTGMVGISKPSKISPEFPISVLKNSKTSSSEIYKLFPSEVQSQESLMQNTIPYKFLMDLRVQIKILSGNLNVAMEPNFQFHSDKNIHNLLKSIWFQRLSTLLRITIQSINRMKVTLSFGGYGKQQYSIWNAIDWLLEIIDEKGKLNEKHIYKTENDGGVTVYEYYKVLHNIASTISKEYSPAHADLIIKCLLPKNLNKSLLNIKIKEKYSLEQVLNDILLNWHKTLDADSFKTKYGQANELWNIFTSRSDLDTAVYLVSILQKIAYISRCSSSEINPKLKKSYKMFGFTSVLYPTLNKLIELYSSGANYDFLKGKTPLNEIIQSPDSQVPFGLVALADNLLEILCTPWKLIHNPISSGDKNSLFKKLAEYIHNRGESVYDSVAITAVDNIWKSDDNLSLFLNEMKLTKAFLGKFGENNLVKIKTATKFYWLNQYISDFEHDFITARCTIVKDDTNADFQLKLGYKFLAAGETLEKGKLPKNLEVARLSNGKLKKSFLDNAIGFINNFVITVELYGYKKILYRNDKNFGALSWIENGYFPVYIPYTDLTRPSKAMRIKELVMKTDVDHPEKTKYIGKISPFTDTITQANFLFDTYAHILANIDKNLRFDDFLTQLRIPENIAKWQIPSVLNKNLRDTISWINRIHWIFGIRVNPTKNFEFDYIINTPPKNPYNLKPDPNYQKKTDPYNTEYDPKMVSEYVHKFKYSPALKITNSTYKNQRTLSYYYKWFHNLKNFIDSQDKLSEFVKNPINKPDLYAKLAYFLIFQKFAGLNLTKSQVKK